MHIALSHHEDQKETYWTKVLFDTFVCEEKLGGAVCAPINALLGSIPTTDRRVPHPSRSLRRVDTADLPIKPAAGLTDPNGWALD